MRILVTGGAGYIGSAICRALADQYLPIAVDDLSIGTEDAVRWGPLEKGNIGDREWIWKIVAQHRPTAIIHCAALARVDESIAEPGKYYRNNVAYTLNLLDAAREFDCKFVFSSTCATYEPSDQPMDENRPQKPMTPYGRSKLMVEQMIRDYGLKYAILRYFNAAGATEDCGLMHEEDYHLIPRIFQAAKGGSFNLYGVDHPTKDGSAVRDYIHIADLAEAHVLALEADESVELNLGTGRGYSVKEVIACAEEVMGKKIEVKVAPRRPGDPPALVADARKAQEVLGWQPKCSDLTTIVRSAWEFKPGF